MAGHFILFAKPWWVNLLIVVPVAVFWLWRKKLKITNRTLLITGLFAVAFGFVEAAVVVYLRGLGYLPMSVSVATVAYFHTSGLMHLSQNYLSVEVVREAATMVMLICVALLAERTNRERLAVYLWAFALWDIFYYAGLYLFIGWPSSLTTRDVLFLIPSPWYAEVWFPLLVSGLTLVAVLAGRRTE